MTSSTRCSGSRAWPPLAAALLIGATACAHRAPRSLPTVGLAEPGARPRVLLLPIDNLSIQAAPLKELRGALERAFGERLELVSGDVLEPFLAKHRLRHTGGLDAAAARAARDELGADAVLITSLELYRAAGPPMLGLTVRLVSVGDEPVILWMDSSARSGDQSPGLLGLGREDRIERVQQRVLAQLAHGLAAFLDGGSADRRCDGGGRYRPKLRFRSKAIDGSAAATLAVVPFLNLSKRRGAGETVSLEFVRQLVATGRYRVLEPGVVRDYLLRARVIMPGGVSLETTRLIVGELGAGIVLSGMVLDFDESPGVKGPTIRFSATMLDAGSGEVLWNSRSSNRGDDGVFLFGLGRIRTPQDLTCRMVASTIDEIGRERAGETWPARNGDKDLLRLTREHPPRPVPPPAPAQSAAGERSAPSAARARNNPGET